MRVDPDLHEGHTITCAIPLATGRISRACVVFQMETSQLLALDDVGIDPDIRETHGRVEPEEDDQRNADVRDDVPGHEAIEMAVQGHRLRLLDLKGVDDPQRQVAEQQEGHQRAPRLMVDVLIVLRTASEPI